MTTEHREHGTLASSGTSDRAHDPTKVAGDENVGEGR
jgi:hypothetical protein